MTVGAGLAPPEKRRKRGGTLKILKKIKKILIFFEFVTDL
jgi:hypothetical protein